VQTELAELADNGWLADGNAAAKRKRPESLTAYDLSCTATRRCVEEEVRLLARAVKLDPQLALTQIAPECVEDSQEVWPGKPAFPRRFSSMIWA
jgi:hypothetical protein